jgi:integrase
MWRPLLRSYHFLQRSRTGVWYFRIRVPNILRDFMGCGEIRRSLKTFDLKEARIEARLLSVYAGRLFLELRRAVATGRPLTLGTMKIPDDIRTFIVQIKTADKEVTVTADPRIPGDSEGAQAALQQLFPQGVPMPSATSPSSALVAPSPRLSEVAERFRTRRGSRGRSPGTVSEYFGAIQEFIDKTGDLPIREISGKHISDYTEFLLCERKPPLSQRTVDKKLNAIAALFERAELDSDWDKKEDWPTKGHCQFKKAKRRHGQAAVDGYHAFTSDELNSIFSPERFRKNLREPHEYWLPLLGLLSGGRINELCQLLVTDIKQEGDVWLIDINAEGHEKKRLKTSAAQRKIPLHPLLIDLGFLEYVELVRNFDTAVFEFPELLFPYLSYTEKNGFGGAPSKKFGRFLDRVGIVGEKKVFHSFRNNLNQSLMNLKLHLEHRSRLMGHEFNHVNVEDYSTDLPLTIVRDDFLARLPLPKVDVSVLRMSRDDFQSMLQKLANARRKQLAHEVAASQQGQPVMRVRKRIPSI